MKTSLDNIAITSATADEYKHSITGFENRETKLATHAQRVQYVYSILIPKRIENINTTIRYSSLTVKALFEQMGCSAIWNVYDTLRKAVIRYNEYPKNYEQFIRKAVHLQQITKNTYDYYDIINHPWSANDTEMKAYFDMHNFNTAVKSDAATPTDMRNALFGIKTFAEFIQAYEKKGTNISRNNDAIIKTFAPLIERIASNTPMTSKELKHEFKLGQRIGYCRYFLRCCLRVITVNGMLITAMNAADNKLWFVVGLLFCTQVSEFLNEHIALLSTDPKSENATIILNGFQHLAVALSIVLGIVLLLAQLPRCYNHWPRLCRKGKSCCDFRLQRIARRRRKRYTSIMDADRRYDDEAPQHVWSYDSENDDEETTAVYHRLKEDEDEAIIIKQKKE